MSHKIKQILLVSKWEFLQFFKWKQELIGKAIMLCVGLCIFFWQNNKLFAPEKYTIITTSQLSIPALPEPFVIEYHNQELPLLKNQLNAGQISGILQASNPQSAQPQFTLITQGKMSWQNEFAGHLSTHFSDKLATRLSLSDTQLQLLKQPIIIHNDYISDKIKDESKQSSTTATGVLILMSIGIFMSFGQIFVSITGEKQQRVTEQLYACMSAQTWIDGKIIGQMLHSLKAMFTTIISFILVIAFIQIIVDGDALDLTMIDFGLLPWLIVFAIFGLYMSTAFMAAIAAAIDDPNHSGKTSFMMIPLLPILIGFLMIDSPSSVGVTFLSFFPLTAFVAMPMKMALIDVPLWQPILALLSTLIGCYVIRVMAGRLFKLGMVMYGKEPSLKTMLTWAIKEPKLG